VHALLAEYDPDVARLLGAYGLETMPTTRLGVALCTRAGFRLQDCLALWDALLADPMRFQFCDYVVIAVLMLRRRELYQCRGDGGRLAEGLLLAPGEVAVTSVLRVAHAICAFERQCGPDSETPFPAGRVAPAPGAPVLLLPPTAALEAASEAASAVWGRLRKSWKAGRQAVRSGLQLVATGDGLPADEAAVVPPKQRSQHGGARCRAASVAVPGR